MIKNKKIKSIMNFCIFLISIAELYFIYKINKEFKGTYEILIFLPLIIIQPFIFRSLLSRGDTISKVRIFLTILIYISIPVIIYFTLPKYTYNDGKDKIEESFKPDEKFEFIHNAPGQYTVPVIENAKQIFMKDREYYYIIEFTNETKYFIVNPITGESIELEERYW